MADLGDSTWSEVDASNNATPPNGWPEGMFPSDVNNAARAQMGGEKRWWARSNSTMTTAGTSTAYTLTYAQAAAAYYTGEEFSFVIDQTCGLSPSLNINGLGAQFLRKFAGGTFVTLAAGDIVANQPIRVRTNGLFFDIVTATPTSDVQAQAKTANGSAAFLDFTGISPSINNLEIAFHLTLASANAVLGIQFYISGVLDTAGHYFTQSVVVNNGAVSGGTFSGLGAFTTGTWGSTLPISGRAWLQNIQNTVTSIGVNAVANGIDITNSTLVGTTVYGGRNAGTIGPITGIRILSTVNITGSVTLISSP